MTGASPLRLLKPLLLFLLVTNTLLGRLLTRAGMSPDLARWATAFLTLAAVVALIGAWRREEGLSWNEMGVAPAPTIKLVLIGAVTGLVSIGSGRLVTKLFGLDLAGNRAGISSLMPDASVQVAVLLFIYALIEELFFRGYLLAALRRSYGRTPALLVTSVLFAAYHASWANAPHHLAMGALLAAVTLYTGSLYPALIAHWLHNSHALLG